jgi:hypothetical protein
VRFGGDVVDGRAFDEAVQCDLHINNFFSCEISFHDVKRVAVKEEKLKLDKRKD